MVQYVQKYQNYNIWCHDDIETCILSSVVVSPRYVKKSQDSSTCYTKKREDLAVGAITNSSQPKPNTNSNSTTDGVYLKGFEDSFSLAPTNYPWIVYNLGRTARIFEIFVSSNVSPKICNDVKIKIGHFFTSTDDFSKYKLLINIKNPCDTYRKEMSFKLILPMVGQFVLVTLKKTNKLKLNYIEIDGEIIEFNYWLNLN